MQIEVTEKRLPISSHTQGLSTRWAGAKEGRPDASDRSREEDARTVRIIISNLFSTSSLFLGVDTTVCVVQFGGLTVCVVQFGGLRQIFRSAARGSLKPQQTVHWGRSTAAVTATQVTAHGAAFHSLASVSDPVRCLHF